jgi:hypothetical protein
MPPCAPHLHIQDVPWAWLHDCPVTSHATPASPAQQESWRIFWMMMTPVHHLDRRGVSCRHNGPRCPQRESKTSARLHGLAYLGD